MDPLVTRNWASALSGIFCPFGETQKDQLENENRTLQGPERDFALLLADFVDLRFQWASAVIDATKNGDASRAAEARELMTELMRPVPALNGSASGLEWIIARGLLPRRRS